jgi:excisionase family DNA binding protein
MNSECQTLSVVDAGRILGVSRNTAYEAVKTGQLPVLRIGRKIRVPKALLERMLTSTGEREE